MKIVSAARLIKEMLIVLNKVHKEYSTLLKQLLKLHLGLGHCLI